MLKRFYSKRSGFTLVEIIIAFAIFAIMASMICQILDLSVKARLSNNAYQRDLDQQERMLSLIEKNQENYTESQGSINLAFETMTSPVTLPFDRQTVKTDAESDGDGINFFLSPVDYQSEGTGTSSNNGSSSGGSNAGSQASRMDTRITGTAGIDNIQIIYVIKDTFNYNALSDAEKASYNPVPDGCTRYYFRIAASAGSNPQTLKQEDVPYSQFRLHFYHMPDPDNTDDKSYLDSAKSAEEHEDENGDKYTEDVNKEARIFKVGYLASVVTETIGNAGLRNTNITAGTNDKNIYTIEQKGTNVVRIGSPFVTGKSWDPNPLSGADGKGLRFDQGNTINFYVDFMGDPHLTKDSFGYNATAGNIGNSAKYTACPDYKEEYDNDGTPLYYFESNHVNIYGGYLRTRHYLK